MARNSYAEINLHITWHTKGSSPRVTPQVEAIIHHYLRGRCINTPGIGLGTLWIDWNGSPFSNPRLKPNSENPRERGFVDSAGTVNPPSTAGLNRFAESPVNGAVRSHRFRTGKSLMSSDASEIFIGPSRIDAFQFSGKDVSRILLLVHNEFGYIPRRV